MQPPAEILVVDDAVEIVALLGAVLTDEEYVVRTAYNGVGALDAIEQHPPALVLIDDKMPVLSGLETVKRLRARGYDTLPIIVMSATAHAEQCREAGATGFIEKPFHLDDVLDCLERHID